MNIPGSKSRPRTVAAMIGMAILGASVPPVVSYAKTRSAPSEAGVRKALLERLPKTTITAVDCKSFTDMCEVTAGPNIFYVDPTARYLMIGRVYDMETRQDLTAAHLLRLSPDSLVAASAHADADTEGASPDEATTPSPVTEPRPVDLSALPSAGAINWGPASAPRLVVFTDFHCGYCKAMTAELKSLGLRIEERPISILGTRSVSDAVYCAKDPVAALHAAYDGRTPSSSPRCDTRGLDANEAFARDHGFNGTPVVVRPGDGAVIQGYRPAATLAAFAKGGPAS